MKKSFISIIFLLFISSYLFSEEKLTQALKKNIVDISLNPFLQSEEMQHLATIISNKGNTTDLSLRELYSNTYQQNADLERIIKYQKPDGSFSNINYNDQALSSWDPLNHISRLLYVSKAYLSPNSIFYQKEEVSEFLHRGLNAWFRLKPVCKNWWYNEIGVPKTFGVLAILLENELSENEKIEAIKVLSNSGFRMTGQNKVWLAGNVLLKALLLNDEQLIKAARDSIASEIYQTTNEGIQPDFSFHQHGPQQQFGNYGLAFINSLSYYANIFEGTKLAFSNQQLNILRNYILEGENWIIWHGYMDVSACNRQLFKKAQVGKVLSLCVAINQMSQADSTHKNLYEEIIFRNMKPGILPELIGAKHFWRSDLSVFRSSTDYISVRSCSPRVKGTEFTNNENKKGHFISDGCTIFMRRGSEYSDIFPVWDWNRIPGVTAPIVDSIKQNKTDDYHNPNPFVGGLTHNGCGITTFHLARNEIDAKKSWFYLNGMLVCLGADIKTKNGKEIITGVNQCFQKGNAVVSFAGVKTSITADTLFSSTSLNTIWHDSIGYFFPKGCSTTLSLKTQTGNWHEIADPYSTKTVSEKIFKLWVNHGVNATKQNSYAYVVLPSVSQNDLIQFSKNPTTEILSNSSSVQAVKLKNNASLQFVFHKQTRINTFSNKDYIIAGTPGLVQLENVGRNLSVTVADPTQKQLFFKLTISGNYSGNQVTFNPSTNQTEVKIPLPKGDEAGKCVTVEVSRL